MSATFQRFAGICSILVGVGGLAYGLLFGAIVYGADRPVILTWLVVGMVGALIAVAVAVAIYLRLRETDRGFALVALLLGLVGTLGQFENSGFALSAQLVDLGGEASDPAGHLRFGLAGVSLFIVGWLIVRGGAMPKRLGQLGMAGGVLLVLVYLGRVTGVIDPAEKITTLPPVLYGVVIHPIFYIWLGWILRKENV